MTRTRNAIAHWVELEGCYNFRDLGVYSTADGRSLRGGQVFRADGLQHLTEADIAHLREVLGLGVVIDLRSDGEVAADGRGRIADEALELHHVPLFAETARQSRSVRDFMANMGEVYFFMLSAAREPISRVVRLLAESERPAVFHCAAGKDRTGVVSALLLSLLGVPDETIVMDYALSRKNLDRITERLNASESYRDLMTSLPDDAYEAEPETMRAFLARVRAEHGSMRAYAESAGISADLVERLQRRLLL